MSDTPQQPMDSGNDVAHDVIEAIYDLPLGGPWSDVQEALCGFWAEAGQQPDQAQIQRLERHFERVLGLLERLPAEQNRWRRDLYRMPVPACTFTARGELVDANESGQLHLGMDTGALRELDEGNQRAVRKACETINGPNPATAVLLLSGGRQLRLYLNRLPDDLHPQNQLYLAVIVSPVLPEASRELLMEQYRLTPAEARLCLQLAAGNSLDALSETAKVKKSTLRTQLANCFSKLEVKSQPELVAVVLHNLFAGAQLAGDRQSAPVLTPYLDPELHGYPRFATHSREDGGTLGYFEYGDADGVPCFYLHGSLDGALIMKNQKLSGTGVRLLALERYGVGESTPAADPSPEAYARDIARLADALQLRAYAVIGRSMGSWDAVSVALEDPRAKLLVLAGGRLPVADLEHHTEHRSFYRSLYHAIWHSEVMGRLMLRAMLLQLRVKGPGYFVRDSEELPMVERKLIADPMYLRHMKALWLRAALHGAEPIHAHLSLYRQPVADPPWRNLKTPALLVHGDADTEVPIERLVEQTRSFKQRQVVALPNIGHRLVHVAMGELLHTVRETWRNL